jgi:hypothetical protein
MHPPGDVNAIEVGNNTNVQDNVVIHTARHTVDGKPRATIIGNNVTIGEHSFSNTAQQQLLFQIPRHGKATTIPQLLK